jgi:trk system potassium uptake protein TrkH
VAALQCAPLLVSLISGEYRQGLSYLPVIAVLALLGVIGFRLRGPKGLQVNEVLVIAASTFCLVPLLTALPMTGPGVPFIDALFEAVSGVTTTGLSTLSTVEDKTATFLFSRAWMQWYGGLGIVVFSLALFISPGRRAKDLAVSEAGEDDLIGGTKAHARRILRVYGALTVLGMGALLVAGTGLFDSVLYILASVSTGGYAPYDDSLAGLGSGARQIVCGLSFLSGAFSLTVYSGLFRKRGGARFEDLELLWLIGLGLVFSALAYWFMADAGAPAVRALLDGPMLAFSAQTTAGFSGVDVGAQSDAVKALMLLPMLIGGGVGSTAGGFKIIRLLIALKMIAALVRKASLTRHARHVPGLLGRDLDEKLIADSLQIITLYLLVTTLSWLTFVAHGYAPLDSLFDVVSAVGTVGLSTGVTGPELPALLKGVLMADMLMGRLEIVAILVLIYPGTWIGRRWKSS